MKICQQSSKIQQQESISKALMERIDEEKVLDEGLAQRLVSFNEKLTNFYEKRALSEFGEERLERDFCKVILAIKSLWNEWNEGSIYRV